MINRLGLLLTLLITVAGAYVFYTYFEAYEEEFDLGWDAAARRNQYLAAEQYLKRQLHDVNSVDSFDRLAKLPQKGTIFLSDSNSVVSGKRLEELIVWLREGGNLIVAAGRSESGDDRLLSYFDISVYETEYRPEDQQHDATEHLQSESEEGSDGSGTTVPADNDQRKRQSEQLRKYNERLKEQLEEGETVIEAYEEVARRLGVALD